MKVFESQVMVGSDDNPDDRTVKFTHGHVDQEAFAKLVGVAFEVKNGLPNVIHCWASYDTDCPEGTELEGWWDLEKTELCPEAITMVFV